MRCFVLRCHPTSRKRATVQNLHARRQHPVFFILQHTCFAHIPSSLLSSSAIFLGEAYGRQGQSSGHAAGDFYEKAVAREAPHFIWFRDKINICVVLFCPLVSRTRALGYTVNVSDPFKGNF